MLGAVYGDYLGSKFEKIPNKELRKECSITDDSWLSFAQLDWLIHSDITKFSYLFKQNQQFSSREFAIFSEELSKAAKKSLVKWVDIGMKYADGDIIPGFSPGMLIWAEKEKGATIGSKRKTDTNGCIMRNSPIFDIGFKKGLSLEECLCLAEMFAKTTHDSESSKLAVKTHTTIGYLVKEKKINLMNFRKALTDKRFDFGNENYYQYFNHLNIQTLTYWLNEKKTKKFIWSAKESLDIAISAIFFSKTYEEFIDFCCKTEMDTDTYAAIGGEIAKELFRKEIPKEFIKYLKSYTEIKEILALKKKKF